MQHEEFIHEEPVESAEERSALERFLGLLPDELRIALQLRFQDDMTFADIARASSCSEPTAYDRVRRGLERLRVRLTEAGFGVVAANLEGGLRSGRSVTVPPALREQLLSLPAAKAAIALPSAVTAVVLCATVAALLGLGWHLMNDKGAPTGPTPGAELAALPAGITAPQDPPTREEVVTEIDEADGEELIEEFGVVTLSERKTDWTGPEATLRGIVVDVDGRPLPGLDVAIRSARLDGKLASVHRQTIVGPDGSYSITVPITLPDFEEFTALVQYEGCLVHAERSIRLAPDQELERKLVVETIIDERPGAFTLHVQLLDPSGAPVTDALVILNRRIPKVNGGRSNRWEASGRTDADGRILLAGAHLGRKQLDLQTGAGGETTRIVDLTVDEPGATIETLTVNYPHSIAGRVIDESGREQEGLLVTARSAGDASRAATTLTTDGGAFSFLGLAAGSYHLEVDAGAAGVASKNEVACGTGGVELVLQPAGDVVEPEARSIAGRMIDARTGQPLFAVYPDVEALAVPDMTPEQVVRDFLPNQVFSTVAQWATFGDPPPPSDQFHLSSLQPKRYLVRGFFDERAPAFAGPFDLTEFPTLSSVQLRFDVGGQVEGVVLDANGRPLEGALVFVTGSGPISDARVAQNDQAVRSNGGQGYQPFQAWRTDQDGRFRSDSTPLPVGLPLRLAAVHPTHEPVVGGVVPIVSGKRTGDLSLRFNTARRR